MRLKSSKGYNWRFFKAGGAYQPLIERGSDIAAVGELDMKLWAALSCPTRGLYFDEKTLDFMDADKDGRIRRDDVVAACEFACAALKNPDTLAEGADSLKLSDIDENSISGKRLRVGYDRQLVTSEYHLLDQAFIYHCGVGLR